MKETDKKNNYFVRILLVLLCIMLTLMICFNFFYVEPYGDFKYGSFILLSMLIILVLAESFDSFSIGKLISIKREFENKKEENKILEQRNSELINQILSITINQNQRQQTNTYIGDNFSTRRKNVQRDKSDKDNVQDIIDKVNNDTVQELLDSIGTSIVIKDLEDKITKGLKEKDLEIDTDTSKVLLRYFVGTVLLLEFERIHSIIFGSQIFLLKELNIKKSGVADTEVIAHFNSVKQAFPVALANWDCEQYLTFLYTRLLITKNPDNTIHITNLGSEYLQWIIKNGQREDKPL